MTTNITKVIKINCLKTDSYFSFIQLSTNVSKNKLESTVSKTGSPTRARSQSPGKGGKKGGKGNADKTTSPKKDTKLKKRGEESDIIETIGNRST